MRSKHLAWSLVLGSLLSLFDSGTAHAQTPLACGTDTIATIAVNGEVDTYTFSGTAGEVVEIAVGESVADSFFEPCWQLFAPGGAPVNALTCAPGSSTSGTPAQVIALAATGTYTIQVSEQQGTRTGSYEINWHGLSASNSCGAATTFCADIAGAINPGGDIDSFAFTGAAGEVVSIALGEVLGDSFFEPCWRLYAPDGSAVNALTCGPASSTTGTVAQTIALPASGTYTLAVTEASADFRTGTYQLNVHGLSSTNACGAAASFCADPAAEISPGGDIDTYAFDATAGEVVSIAIGEILVDSFFEPCWQLFAPDGSPVSALVCAPASSTSGTPAQVVALPSTGSYTIEVTEANGDYRTGTYQLDVHGLSASNSCGAPTPFCADFAADITPAADIDTYSFSGTAGQVLSIAIGETLVDSFFEPCWQLFAPDGSPVSALVCAPASSTSGTPAQVVALPSTGSYTIEVTEANGDYRTGTYQLDVHGLSASNTCGTPMTLCTDNVAAITPAGDLDSYTLAAAAGDVVSIAVGETVLDSFFEPCWQIFGPTGAALNAQACGTNGTPTQAITLPSAGTYTVLVSEANGDYRTGGYGLKADGLSASVACGPTIGCGSDATSTLSRLGEMDTYRYTGTAGEVVSISIGEPVADAFLDLCGQLFDPNGALVGTRTCGASNLTARMVRTLPSAGTYTLEISDSQGDRSGSYDYSLQRILPTASQCGTATACGVPAIGGVAQRPGDTKTFSFLAGAGDVVTINVTETFASGGFTPCWQLFAPSGTPVGALQCGTTTASAARTLTETGVQTVEVSEDALDTAWVYSFALTGPLAGGVCTTPCGNGALDAGEACDDGNLGGVDCCSPLCQIVPDSDGDSLCDRVDNCPTVANLDQNDLPDGDGVGQVCDTCPQVANPRVTTAQRQIWMTLVSGQRDDDADGRGNRCDFDHDNTGPVITANDFNLGKASVADLVNTNLCGPANNLSCARFDQDETGPVITSADFNLLKAAVASLVPARCGPACTPPFTGAIGKAPCEGPGC